MVHWTLEIPAEKKLPQAGSCQFAEKTLRVFADLWKAFQKEMV
jgi:hypothetical protein